MQKFTFYFTYITTGETTERILGPTRFTFYFTYITTINLSTCSLIPINLHSTLLILQPSKKLVNASASAYLHSTLLILQQFDLLQMISVDLSFTFYFTYITTDWLSPVSMPLFAFTFYFTYITTPRIDTERCSIINLHSTLLILQHMYYS